MRYSAVFLICPALWAQRPEDAVTSVVKQVEQAIRTGNGDAYFSLWSSKSEMAAHSEIKSMIRPRPEIRYRATNTLIDGDRAAAIGSMDNTFFSMELVREEGGWKLLKESYSEQALDPAMLYAVVPPADGSFARSGSDWSKVARAGTAKWKMQAVADETYLYVRIDALTPLPAQGSEVQGDFPNLNARVDQNWPVMKIRSGVLEVSFRTSIGVGDRATFDEQGKANSHHHFLSYSLWVTRGDATVFESNLEPLISVHDSFIDLRFPLKALGTPARIEILDANRPASFAPYDVKHS